MPLGKISKKQEGNFRVSKSELLSKGYPPAVREICEAVHLKSTSSVHSHLETLRKMVIFAETQQNRVQSRSLDDTFNLTRREVVNVPVIGCVAAGAPILAEENIENYFPIPMEFMPNEKTFLLSVKGESSQCGNFRWRLCTY